MASPKRYGGRMTDLDRRAPQDIEAEEEAERQGLVASSDEIAEWLDGWHEDEDDPERLDHSYSRGGSAWPGSWGGGRS